MTTYLVGTDVLTHTAIVLVTTGPVVTSTIEQGTGYIGRESKEPRVVL